VVSAAQQAQQAAERVADPELPMLSLADLGVLRAVHETGGGSVVVTLTPTYSGCPALETMRADLRSALAEAGYPQAEIRTVLDPPWSSDDISAEGRRKLAEAGIAPPTGTAPKAGGPVPLTLEPPPALVTCPQCGSPETEELARFSATACRALRRCRACAEPFEQFKEV
jgi:ring-1,2-phenylacetyl-CoA epoxidase subunit PaaD